MHYLITIEYLKPLPEIDVHTSAHREFVDRHLKAGNFILSGPTDPRNGGVILAVSSQLSEVESWVAADPYNVHGLARYKIYPWKIRARSSLLPEDLFPETTPVES